MSVSRDSGYLIHFGSERRPSERRVFKSPARLMLAGQPSQLVRTQELGVDGLEVVCALNLGAGLSCGVRFRLPAAHRSNDEIQAQARVTHSILSGKQGGFVISLRFAEIADDSLAAIKQYLRA
jgi:hypothetical protein